MNDMAISVTRKDILLRDIEAVLDPHYLDGRVLPAYVGSHEDARIRAIEGLLQGYRNERGGIE
jgi:hypothetical protein